MISPPRNRVGTVADAVSRSDLLPRADSGAVLREHELRVVRCRYPLCPRRDCHPKGASAFGPPIRRIAPGKCHSATGDVHRFGARPSKTNNEPRLHPPFLASSCRKATPLPFEQDQLLWPPPSHRYSSRGRPSGQRRNVIRTAPKPEYKLGTGTGRPSGQRRNVIRTAPPKRRTSSRPTGRT